MAEVLSQSEIDALLSALSSGELQPEELPKEEKQKVKLNYFMRPKKFSKEHIKTLELIHENYARIISNYLTMQVRSNVRVKIESIEQVTYEEFHNSMPNPTVLTIFKMPPLNGLILFEINPRFAFQIIDVLLGGTGNSKYRMREFTDIEKNIIKHVNEGLIKSMKPAWEEYMEVEPEIEGLETNPSINQTMAPIEPVLLITLSVEMNKSTAFINICIPYISIEKVLDKLINQYDFQEINEEVLRESREKLKNRLNVVTVSLTGVLGSAAITVDDFLKLSVGDVITLKEKSSSPVKLQVEDNSYYYGKPGVVGKNLAIQILDTIDKDVENYE